MYKYHFKTLLSVLLGIHPKVELLDHMVNLYLIFLGTSVLFSIAAVPVYSPQESFSSHLCQHLSSLVFLNLAILIGVK